MLNSIPRKLNGCRAGLWGYGRLFDLRANASGPRLGFRAAIREGKWMKKFWLVRIRFLLWLLLVFLFLILVLNSAGIYEYTLLGTRPLSVIAPACFFLMAMLFVLDSRIRKSDGGVS